MNVPSSPPRETLMSAELYYVNKYRKCSNFLNSLVIKEENEMSHDKAKIIIKRN